MRDGIQIRGRWATLAVGHGAETVVVVVQDNGSNGAAFQLDPDDADHLAALLVEQAQHVRAVGEALPGKGD
jgi:glutamate-1-semialdehyde aminotransferase